MIRLSQMVNVSGAAIAQDAAVKNGNDNKHEECHAKDPNNCPWHHTGKYAKSSADGSREVADSIVSCARGFLKEFADAPVGSKSKVNRKMYGFQDTLDAFGIRENGNAPGGWRSHEKVPKELDMGLRFPKNGDENAARKFFLEAKDEAKEGARMALNALGIKVPTAEEEKVDAADKNKTAAKKGKFDPDESANSVHDRLQAELEKLPWADEVYDNDHNREGRDTRQCLSFGVDFTGGSDAEIARREKQLVSILKKILPPKIVDNERFYNSEEYKNGIKRVDYGRKTSMQKHRFVVNARPISLVKGHKEEWEERVANMEKEITPLDKAVAEGRAIKATFDRIAYKFDASDEKADPNDAEYCKAMKEYMNFKSSYFASRSEMLALQKHYAEMQAAYAE